MQKLSTTCKPHKPRAVCDVFHSLRSTKPTSALMNFPTNISVSPPTNAVDGIGAELGNAGPCAVPFSLDQERRNARESTVMIVDDEELVIRVIKRFLTSDGYSKFVTVTDPREAFQKIQEHQPDVVLLDIMMPHISGLELLRQRQDAGQYQQLPFIILSANSEANTKREALNLGATDFLNKPVDPFDLVLRVQNALIVKRHYDHLQHYASDLEKKVHERTQLLEHSREQIIHCLARAAEYRDNETGEHVIRVGKYCRVIASQLGFDSDYCRQIELAAQLHDVGKIGIPDSVLLNPGKLSQAEFEVMKTHCGLGCDIMEPLAEVESDQIRSHVNMGPSIIQGIDSPMLQMAAVISRTHHEKWDGTGYPNGLSGESIPLEGRITCVADVYDALCSERPYKPKFPIKRCLEIMLSERGTRFDPEILDAFLERIRDIERIRREYDDQQALDEIQKQKKL